MAGRGAVERSSAQKRLGVGRRGRGDGVRELGMGGWVMLVVCGREGGCVAGAGVRAESGCAGGGCWSGREGIEVWEGVGGMAWSGASGQTDPSLSSANAGC